MDKPIGYIYFTIKPNRYQVMPFYRKDDYCYYGQYTTGGDRRIDTPFVEHETETHYEMMMKYPHLFL